MKNDNTFRQKCRSSPLCIDIRVKPNLIDLHHDHAVLVVEPASQLPARFGTFYA